MDIKIGSVPAVQSFDTAKRSGPQVIEARVLAVRLPRKRSNRKESQVERRGKNGRGGKDPANGRVLVLMVPDSNLLPSDFDSNNYRVFLRFARS